MFIGSYTKQDLYEMWSHFKDNPDADTILSDFMRSDKKAAQELIKEFEITAESFRLGYYFCGNKGQKGTVL